MSVGGLVGWAHGAAAAVAAGACVWVLVPPGRRLIAGPRSRRRLPAGMPVVLGGVGALTVGGWLGGLAGLLWTVILLCLALTGGWLAWQSRAERRRRLAAADVAHATQTVAGQLRIGAVPSVALVSAATDSPCMERPAATQAIGGDVGRALRVAGDQPGRDGLVSLARAWELGERTGAPIAELALQVSDQIRQESAARRLIDAELAGPRATARLLAFLPVVGILMGRLSGGDPVGFLTRSLPGQLCLTGGVLLACAGVLWTEHMARRVGES
ncbi:MULTISPECIES: type II secretion system F family protein [unclassified Luteococcus]|uniref:type II secretion system F family protein n=1 Tax=unclassified Luteococcus TaxID=2639923 RepID=UPI00313DC4C7